MMDIVNPLETDLNLSYNINKQALAMFHQKATRAADKMETLGMLDERGDLFSLMQSVDSRRPKNTTSLRDQQIFKSFVGEDQAEAEKETRALPTDLFTDHNKPDEAPSKSKVKAQEMSKQAPSPTPQKHHGSTSASPLAQNNASQATELPSKMRSWGGEGPLQLKEEGTERVLRSSNSPPPEERVNLKKPLLRDLFSHSVPNKTTNDPGSSNTKKIKSNEEQQRLEKLKAKYLRIGKKDPNPSKPPKLKL